MLSRDLGGIQQAFLDYDKALRNTENQVINITSYGASINSSIFSTKIPNLGNWDILSKLYLKLIIFFSKPQIIVAHGNRAIIFAKFFSTFNNIPVVAIAHNHNIKYLTRCDYIIALTKYMQQYLISNNFAANKIVLIPNMMKIERLYQDREFRNPVVIGTIARFVKKKAIDVFLRSLFILKEQNIPFKALIGGDGEEKEALIKLSNDLELDQQVHFLGWINDKEQFFADIDIFCLPSSHEPFGIVVLEALQRSTPIVATKSEGPIEIIRSGIEGLLCQIDDPQDLAEKLKFMIDNPGIACKYAKSGYLRLKQNYAIEVVATKINSFFKIITSQ